MRLCVGANIGCGCSAKTKNRARQPRTVHGRDVEQTWAWRALNRSNKMWGRKSYSWIKGSHTRTRLIPVSFFLSSLFLFSAHIYSVWSCIASQVPALAGYFALAFHCSCISGVVLLKWSWCTILLPMVRTRVRSKIGWVQSRARAVKAITTQLTWKSFIAYPLNTLFNSNLQNVSFKLMVVPPTHYRLHT